MSVVKNINQRTTNNSFNTYPIGMNSEAITIPAGTANLYENSVDAEDGINILKEYIDAQLSSARVNFFVDYTDMNNQVYNLRVYNDNSTNGSGLRNVINNLPENISNLSVKQLYAPSFVNASNLFLNNKNIYNINNIELINTENTSNMFKSCINLSNINVLNLGFNIKNSYYMFYNCYNLINIPNFNTSNVTNIYRIFDNCNSLTNINKLNLNKVTEIYHMIDNCINLSNSSILNIANSLPYYDNIVNANKYNTLDYIGFSNKQINVIINNPYASNYVENHGWALPKANYELAYTNTSNPDVWINYNLLNQPITSNAKTLRDAFRNKDIDTANIVKLNVINLPGVTNGYFLFANNGSNYNFSKMTNVEHLDIQDLQNASRLFYNDRNLISVNNINCNNINNCYGMFSLCQNLTTVSNFNTSKVTNMGSMFNACYDLIAIPNFDTSNVVFMNNAFGYCEKISNIPNFNTSKVTVMNRMLNGCHNLKNVPNFDTSNVIGMGEMFTSCWNLINIPNFNTSNVINTSQMFAYCNNLINSPAFNMTKVTNMSHMYGNCRNLINIFNFNTSNATQMYRMFSYCNNLSNQSIDNIAYSLPLYKNIINGNPSINQYIGLSNTQINNMSANAKQAAEDKGWMVNPQIRIDYTYLNGVNGVNKVYNIDTMTGQEQYQNLRSVLANTAFYQNILDIALYASDNNISNMSMLFQDIRTVKNINIQINTRNVTNMFQMFTWCHNLINIPNLNTVNVINMKSMFSGCYNLINVPNFNTINVTDMAQMFSQCKNLINAPKFNTSNVTNMTVMFANCRNLINISSFDTSNVIKITNIFYDCYNLSQNSLQNIIQSIPDRTQIENTTSTTNLQYLGLTTNQINNLPTYYKQIAADKGWYVEGYEPKYTEMLVGTANALGDITFENTETYPMRLTYDDMFGDYCLENTNQGKANTTSSAILTVSEDLLNVFDPIWNFQVYYSSEGNYDEIRIYKNGDLLYEYSGYSGDTYLEAEFWLEVQAGDVLEFIYHKDSSGDYGLDGCKIYISGWKNNKSYEVRYSTVDAPTTYITKFIPKEDN